ncbi:MAG TPA: sn-glycerol-3-phosphate ABC transporter ATP-binding protein UgpC [Solirubrobacteraceae bacterium]|nr:sn-glycerol-3-phosphate ABC transporter ATP-binding protein UgpC [Solirubrobacteraceae bacterium]
MANISFENVTKRFPDQTVAVDSLTLEISDGEFIVLVGPSGSGKSTALRMVAGLEEITEGIISIGGRVVNGLTPKERDTAMVFQNYALYPNMSVYGNMEFGLKLRKMSKQERKARVTAAAKMLGIGELLNRRPAALSGGQRQRVAMGRAIVREPQAFLMDEPLSNLDAKLRVQMRTEIARVHQQLKTTTMFVTHDQTEAMTMGDRVAVMRQGSLEQVDTPQELYERPVNVFVGGFIGSPAMNMVHAHLVADGDKLFAQFGSRRIVVPGEQLSKHKQLAGYKDREVILGIRPEDLEDAEFAPGSDPDTLLDVEIALAEPMGAELVTYFEIDVPPVITKDTRDLMSDVDELSAAHGKSMLTARIHSKSSAHDGKPLKVVVDVTRLYFFDPQTEAAIR